MERKKITLKRISLLVFSTLALLAVLLVLYIGAGLAWIAYRPLPPVPKYGVRYNITEAGGIGSNYLDFDDCDSLDYGVRLTDTGQMVHLDEATLAQDKVKRQSANKVKAEEFKLSSSEYVSTVGDNGDSLVAISNGGWLDGWQLWRHGKPVASMPPRIRGYDWKPGPLFFGFRRINARGETIGNGRIATAYASSGGTSNPHGRWLPVIWRGTGEEPEDLNGRIDRASGWYLDRALDINNSGQILCIGRRTDIRGAEDYDADDAHWVILTPT